MIDQLSNPWWFFVLFGLCAGILSGALGLGAGIILVPTLVLLCTVGQKSAQGTALAVMVPMALLGALRYWNNPQVEMNAVLIGLIVCGALIGTLAGTELASRLPSHILRKAFAIFLVIAAMKMFFANSNVKSQGVGNDLTKQQNVNLVEYGSKNGSEQ